VASKAFSIFSMDKGFTPEALLGILEFYVL
jgi:hypothetical protein